MNPPEDSDLGHHTVPEPTGDRRAVTPSGHGPVPHTGAARGLIDDHESRIRTADRRARGAHYTPAELADFLASRAVGTATDRMGYLPRSVCDTSCGAGAFLVAAAEQLALRGVDPVEIITSRITGFDIDPSAVAVARRALVSWAEARMNRNLGELSVNVSVLDVLDPDVIGRTGRYDVVIGNPPFLTQLRSDTALERDRFEQLTTRLGDLDPYVDTSALFLLLATMATNIGGVTCLIQPQSFLSLKGSQKVRDQLLERCDLVALWSSRSQFFDASVRVCAVITSPRQPRGSDAASAEEMPAGKGPTDVTEHPGTAGTGRVTVMWGGTPQTMDSVVSRGAPPPRAGVSWGPLLAGAMGIPSVELGPRRTLGEVAGATAGFRDEYYAIRDACVELGSPGASNGDDLRLTSVGMIRPCGSDWGIRPSRIGGRTWIGPSIDLDALISTNPRVAAWVRSRLVPKVLVATQTRVVEAVADPDGTLVPLTPVISVEPTAGWEALVDPSGDFEVDLWWIVAALSAPPVSALALSENLGSGLSAHSLRWSAGYVRRVPLPVDPECWAEGATVARRLSDSVTTERERLLEQLGHTMCAAHDLAEADDLFTWWFERVSRA